MKKKLMIIGVLGFTFLFGCNVDNENVEAGIPEGWVRVEYNGGDMKTYGTATMKHLETGCYYAVYGDAGLVQMRTADDKPYCD